MPKGKASKHAKARAVLIAKYDHYYKPHYLCATGKCVYCGQPSQHIDHCPPLSWVNTYGSEYFTSKHIPFYKLTSCKDCNLTLSDLPYFTIRQRKGYMAAVLRERFSKELQNPMWESDEINELGHTLRSYVDIRQGYRLVLERRLDFATSD